MSALDHDWQSVFAKPKPQLGERAKTRLLILLCALWVCFGLTGHAPWKPEEMQAVSILRHMLQTGDWLFPVMAGELWLKNPPLYYLSAAFSATLFHPLLPLHDAARLINALWMSLTLLLVGMSGRELWGVGSGRQACLLFIGSIGLVFSAHTLSPEVAGLTGCALAFYALALAPRRPARAGLLLGCGIGIGFMAKGPLIAEVIIVTTLLLPLLFEHWRRLSYIQTLLLGFVVAFAWIAPWLLAFHQQHPQLLQTWLAQSNTVSRSFFYLACLAAGSLDADAQ
jgi:4-amino-4-deoxy-L-arabinose transferase-like glycosyltransferase